MNNEFREHLTELANKMNGIDMYDNVLTASRKRTIRRTVLAAGAAVVMVGGLVGVGLTVLPSADAEPPPGDDKKGEQSQGIPGQLYYPDDDGNYTIVEDGQTVGNPWAKDSTISHDGKMAAWLEESSGFLIADDAEGTVYGQFPPGKKDLGVDNPCVRPTWSPIDDHLLYAVEIDGDATRLQIQIRDVSTSELTASFPADGACNFRWAADGTGLVAQMGYQGDMVAMDVDGSGRNEFSVPSQGAEVSLFSVSAGSKEICVAQGFQHSDDEPYSRTCNATVDPETGQVGGSVSGGGGVDAVHYTADGHTLIRKSTETGMSVTLYDAKRDVLAEYKEPEEYADYRLAQYLP